MIWLSGKKLQLIPLVLYWPFIFILTHIPIPQVIINAHLSDKILHILSCLILTFLVWFAIRGGEKLYFRDRAVWWMILALIVYSAADEWTQGYVGRTRDIIDFLCNLIGLATGLVLLRVLNFYTASLLVTVITIFGLTQFSRTKFSEYLGTYSVPFHLLAYGFLTFLWIVYLRNHPLEKLNRITVIKILLAPLVLMVTIEAACGVTTKVFRVGDMIWSGAIIVIAGGIYIWANSFKKKATPADKKSDNQGFLNGV